MTGKEQYNLEHRNRINQLSAQSAEGPRPHQIAKSEIDKSISAGNPLIQPNRPFVGMGHDGFSNEWFPTGSFNSKEEALRHIAKKRDEETRIYSRYAEEDGFEISTTFHAFTRDGIEVDEPEDE